MNDENDPKLEALIARKLRGLPDVSAPASLAPAVLAALRARQAAPWWRRSWFEWPRPWRLVSLPLSLLLIGGLGLLLWQAWPGAQTTLEGWRLSFLAGTGAVADWLRAPAEAVATRLDAVPRTVWVMAAAVAAALYLACIGLGTVFVRFLLNSQNSLKA